MTKVTKEINKFHKHSKQTDTVVENPNIIKMQKEERDSFGEN